MREAARERVCRLRCAGTWGSFELGSNTGNGTAFPSWRARDEGGKREERAGSVSDGGGMVL